MLSHQSLGKDHYAALVLISIGIGALGLGLGYQTGTLNDMGPGFVPATLGSLLILVGLLLGVSAAAQDEKKVAHTEPDIAGKAVSYWRSWLAIVGGVSAFVVLGSHGGLVPATFVSIFVSALGDRENKLRSAAGLAAILTVLGVVVFHYGLKLPFALFQWSS